MKYQKHDHNQNHGRRNFKEQRSQHRNGHFAELKKVQDRLLPAACLFDMGGAMTEIIGKAGGQPKRQHEIHQHSPQDLVGPHVKPPLQRVCTDKSAAAANVPLAELIWNSLEIGGGHLRRLFALRTTSNP